MSKSLQIAINIVVAVIVIWGLWFYFGSNHSLPPASGPAVVGRDEHCGGNMMNAPICQPGYHCAPVPESNLPFGDVGGICVAD